VLSKKVVRFVPDQHRSRSSLLERAPDSALQVTRNAIIERRPFRLRPELSPRGIDFPNPYLENVAPQYGIYEVTPYILVLYYNTEPGGPRPKNFSLPKEDDHRYIMMVFRRVK
jgi:hypothetical protein